MTSTPPGSHEPARRRAAVAVLIAAAATGAPGTAAIPGLRYQASGACKLPGISQNAGQAPGGVGFVLDP
jgi:hypothetical protein